MAFHEYSGQSPFAWRALIVNSSLLFLLILTVIPSIRAQGGEIVDLNRATAEQLQTLPSIGPALAGRIIEHRKKHGSFKRTQDIIAVRGFSARRYRQIAHLLKVK